MAEPNSKWNKKKTMMAAGDVSAFEQQTILSLSLLSVGDVSDVAAAQGGNTIHLTIEVSNVILKSAILGN